MPSTPDLFHLAAQYRRALSDRIREYLHARGIPDEVIDRHFLGWNGARITIPIFNRKGICAFFRLAKDPDDTSDSPKVLSSRGCSAELYGWEIIRLHPKQVVICEGEFDRLVLEVNGFQAVTSTGGAGTFRQEWAKDFEDIAEVYVCFDRDQAGRRGALRVARMISHAKLVELPPEVGDGGDVTDFFVRLGKSRDEFEKLLAATIPAPPEEPLRVTVSATGDADPAGRERIERIKRDVPIETVVGVYMQLHRSGITLIGLCPFHEDHRPSFTVYPETGTFHCYGCGAHGDALSFIQKVEHLSFRQALDVLERLPPHDETRPE
jgi:hypothetical protein